MSNVVAIRPNGGLTRKDPRRLDLFVKTVGKDLRGTEIDEAIEWCELYGANPFTKDIYFFVFDKDDAEKRRVVPVLGIGLYRKIAARTGDYRPDDKPPRFTYSDAAISPANPKGMIDCEVTVYKYVHGAWFPTTSRLKWDERAPIKAGGFRWEDTGETWPDTGKPKKRKVADGSASVLDGNKSNWHTMPETMMAKCAEADAIRKAWPNEVSGSYVPEEMDQAHTIELTATEIVESFASDLRLKQVGAANCIIIDWCDGEPLQNVPLGQLGDRALAFIREHGGEDPSRVTMWAERNRAALKEYWGRDKAGALAVKQALEGVKQASE